MDKINKAMASEKIQRLRGAMGEVVLQNKTRYLGVCLANDDYLSVIVAENIGVSTQATEKKVKYEEVLEINPLV
jgi:hypothetical protein